MEEKDANFGKVNNALKVLKQSSEFMLDKNPCHFKTPHAAFNLSGIAAPSGSNVALNQELYYYTGDDKEILTNLCDYKITKDATALIK